MGQTVNNTMKPTAAILENIRQASKANKEVRCGLTAHFVRCIVEPS